MSKPNIFKASLRSLKSVKGLCLSAMLIAVGCILNMFFKFSIGQIINISFTFLPIAIAALVLGPIPAMAVGAVSDILACIIKPTGPYFPGFTLNMIIMAFVFSLFFYGKKPDISRIIAARLIIAVIVDITLIPIWLHLLYGTPLVWALYIERLPKIAIAVPIEIILIFLVNTAIYKYKDKF